MNNKSRLWALGSSILPGLLILFLLGQAAEAANWQTLDKDGLHDPSNKAIAVLQNPGDALSRLPPDSSGNKVDWIRALQNGYIKPRSTLTGEKPVEVLDLDIIMSINGSIPSVMFPHKQHTEWIDCKNCHEKLFQSKAGATPVTMKEILDGEYCGVCHGAVSFPLTECNRCHSVPIPTTKTR